MDANPKNSKQILDAAVDAVRALEPDRVEMERRAARVWAQIGHELSAETTARPAGPIRSCDDFRTLIPDYLAGRLSPARSLLFTDHTHECVACRNALDAARKGIREARIPTVPRRSPTRYRRTTAVIAVAAILLVAIALQQAGYLNFLLPVVRVHAMARTIDGRLYRISGVNMSPVSAGDNLKAGDRFRTAADSRAIIELADGTRIEMRERSQLSLAGTHDGVRINLDRGSAIVEAAKQRNGHLYVATEDCTVSVVGTVFAVSTGVKGSRVSVIEGEVHVAQPAAGEKTVRPGQQITTSPTLQNTAIEEEISWSRNLDAHLAMLRALADVNAFLRDRVPGPQLRFNSALLPLLPANTVVYGAFPNVSSALGQAYDLFRQRIEQSPLLRAWWAERNVRRTSTDPTLEEMISHVRSLGGNLGEEIVLAITGGPDGPSDVMVLANVVNVAGVLSELQALGLRVMTEPAQVSAVQSDVRDPIAYLNGTILMLAGSPRAISGVIAAQQSGGTGFAARPFYASIAQSYSKGAGTLFAVDLATLFSPAQRSSEGQAMGLTSVDRLVFEQKQVSGKTMTRADLSFTGERSGVAAWMAPPSPMGALEFVSPQAYGVASVVTKNALTIVDEILGFGGNLTPGVSALENLQRETGVDLRRDLAEPLGGEFLLALDGPLLPSPSWKMVAEVYDSARLQNTLEQLVVHINTEGARAGWQGTTLTSEASGGQIYYRLRPLGNLGPEIHYTYAVGYIVAAPSRALVTQALQYQQSRSSIANATKFRSMMPSDDADHCSAILYQNLTETAGSIANYVPSGLTGVTPEQLQTLRQTVELTPPTLVCAAGEPSRIVMGYQGDLAFNVLMLGGVRNVIQTMWGGRN